MNGSSAWMGRTTTGSIVWWAAPSPRRCRAPRCSGPSRSPRRGHGFASPSSRGRGDDPEGAEADREARRAAGPSLLTLWLCRLSGRLHAPEPRKPDHPKTRVSALRKEDSDHREMRRVADPAILAGPGEHGEPSPDYIPAWFERRIASCMAAFRTPPPRTPRWLRP